VSVGNQLSKAQIDGLISQYAVQMRVLMTAIQDLSQNVNGQGAGLATLEAAGYDSTDAATALTAIGYLNTPAAIYFGTATQTSDFNFNQELSQYWGGQ
jgi:hypothetical protein